MKRHAQAGAAHCGIASGLLTDSAVSTSILRRASARDRWLRREIGIPE
jgi:hypothetical protein